MAEQNPEAFLPGLALSLNNLAIGLGEGGKRTQALAAIKEAIQIYRRLDEQHPGTHAVGLQRSEGVLTWLRNEVDENPPGDPNTQRDD